MTFWPGDFGYQVFVHEQAVAQGISKSYLLTAKRSLGMSNPAVGWARDLGLHSRLA